MKEFKSWFQENQKSIQEDYFTFLRFKSISTDPSFQKEMDACANWVKEYFLKYTDLKAERIKTEGKDLVFASGFEKNFDSVLIYGHYDVQPVDPIELWETDPFHPTQKNGKIFARGACDDKGQIFYALAAMRAYKELHIQPSTQIKFCIEGEEESGSYGLGRSLKSLKEKLQADSLLVIDFDQFDKDTPAVSLGARGIVTFDVTLVGSNKDLHSGMLGGIAYNPNRALVEILSKAVNEKGEVAIEGFYDDIIEDEGDFSFPYDEAYYEREFAIKVFGGEHGIPLAKRNGFRPTFEINGIYGGYTGAGFKTVIPEKASAKVSCRLVLGQDPEKVAKQVEHFFRTHVPKGMEINVKCHGGERAFRANPNTKLANAIRKASKEVCGKACKNTVSGGSIPIVARLCEELVAQPVGMGYGLPTDQIHAPNEHFEWSRFEKGFLTVAKALKSL